MSKLTQAGLELTKLWLQPSEKIKNCVVVNNMKKEKGYYGMAENACKSGIVSNLYWEYKEHLWLSTEKQSIEKCGQKCWTEICLKTSEWPISTSKDTQHN